jgi:protein-tyrosine-phosphatase
MMKQLIFLLSCFVTQVFANTLFVCTGNTGRSYMAEALSTKMLYHKSFSRGLQVQSSLPDAKAMRALAEWNIFYFHQAQEIKGVDLINADLVLTMTEEQKKSLMQLFPQHQNKIHTLSQCATGQLDDIQDPYNKDFTFYQKTRDKIFMYEDVISSRGWKCK